MKSISILLAAVFALSVNQPVYAYNTQQIQNILVQEAHSQGVSAPLVLAIAKVESDFNPSARSHVGALGVMQIMPTTAQNGFNVASHQLYDARVNIRTGVAFIKQLIQHYKGNVEIALSHYNGGSAVRGTNGELAVIPATQNYVNKVLYYAQAFQQTQPDLQKHALDSALLSYSPTLTYAQLMALDEPQLANGQTQSSSMLQTDLLDQVAANEYHTSDTVLPRVTQLQQLREHNLTRLLPPKNKASVDNSGTLNHTQAVTQISYDKTASPPTVNKLNLPLSAKQQKVAQWEAIFNAR